MFKMFITNFDCIEDCVTIRFTIAARRSIDVKQNYLTLMK